MRRELILGAIALHAETKLDQSGDEAVTLLRIALRGVILSTPGLDAVRGYYLELSKELEADMANLKGNMAAVMTAEQKTKMVPS